MRNNMIVTILMLMILEQVASNEDPLNVGTVLFSNSDLKKKKWSANEVGLLRAREYFQHVIPPGHLLYRVNEHFVDNLLDYFRTGYSSIKRESTDPTTDKTMTVALSDAIGGYLKSWVLPITKFAYYGGSISKDNAVKMFNFYKDVKRYLKTDGKAWNEPDPELLNLIEINIEPPKFHRTRSLLNPCQYLAYYIKTPVGLVVPTPSVKWTDQGSTMFLPLKNDSLVPLESESAMNALFKYYDVAKNCIESSNQGDQNFDERFQTWLSTDIVPHLNDDKLYVGLGSVLSLFNGTKYGDGFEETFNEVKTNLCRYYEKLCNIDFSSKKVIVITLIILLEIVWCIPTLILLLCKRKKTRSTRSSISSCSLPSMQFIKKKCREGLKLEKKANKFGKKGKFQTASRVQIDSSDYDELFIAEEVQNAGTMCSSVSKNSIGTCTQSYFSSKVCSAEVAKIIYEGPSMTNKRSVKQILTQKSDANIMCTRDVSFPKIDPNFYCKSTPLKIEHTSSRAVNQILEPSPTVTLLNGSNRTVNKYESKHETCCCSVPQSSTETVKNVDAEECLCAPCIETKSSKNCKTRDVSKTEMKTNTHSEIKTNHSEIETATTASKSTRLKIQKEKRTSKNKGIKLSTTKPYVEITIERPRNEISVGITTVTTDKPPTSPRPSRIPKRSVRSGGEPAISPKPIVPPEDRLQRKSFIPQPRKQILAVTDDIVLKRSTASKTNKLNVTL